MPRRAQSAPEPPVEHGEQSDQEDALYGKYGGELWATFERDKFRAQAELRIATRVADAKRIKEAAERLASLIQMQGYVEEEFPTAALWGKHFIQAERIEATRAEENTKRAMEQTGAAGV